MNKAKVTTTYRKQGRVLKIHCPACSFIAIRHPSYYHRFPASDKCPKCLANYTVNFHEKE
jgi:ribosomal protein S27E